MIVQALAERVNEILNIPRLYTALSEWGACLIYIYFNPKRTNKKSYNALISVLFLVVITFFHLWSETWNIQLWILGMIISAAIMFLFINSMIKADAKTKAYVTVIAFIVSEFVASLEWQLEYFFITNSSRANLFKEIVLFSPFKLYHLRINIMMLFIFGIIFVVMYFIEKRYQKNKKTSEIRLNDLLATFTIGVLIFSISNFSFLNINTPITSSQPMEIFYIRTLVDLVGVIVLYSQKEHKYANEKSIEISVMENLLNTQYRQFLSSQKSQDLINQQYHDLRNHLNVIRIETDYKKQQKHIEELEKTLNKHERVFQTDNATLDIILASKHNEIIENNISFSLVIDGEELNFIKTIDLVSIFGNALDNAIESLKKIEDKAKRLLKVVVFKHANLLVIRIENYYLSKLKYQQGRLITTKENSLYHGYGLKSISQAVEKYLGNVHIETENNWFALTIMIPRP